MFGSAPSVSQATRAAYLYQCAAAYREIVRPLADVCHNFYFANNSTRPPSIRSHAVPALHCSRLLRIHQHEQDSTELRAMIDPSVVCCLLHDHIALL